MEYLTGYYWQQREDNRTSVLLQQGKTGRRRQEIVFCCVCTGERTSLPVSESGYFTLQLNNWYREEALAICEQRRTEKRNKLLTESLERCVRRTDGELAYSAGGKGRPVAFSGALCVESSFLLFYRGAQQIFLLNNRFRHKNLKKLAGETEQFTSLSGCVQPGVGLLFATDAFYQKLTWEQLKECLAQREIGTEQQVKKRLKELGDNAALQGGCDLGAVYLLTQA